MITLTAAPVHALAARQHGVVAMWQHADLDMSRSAFRNALRGATPIVGGVVLLPGVPPSELAAVIARVLVHGPGALATGQTALWLLGVRDRAPGRIEVVVPWSRRGRRAGASGRAVRSRTLEPRDASTAQGVPCATFPRALLDIAARRSVEEIRAALIDGEQRNLVDFDLTVRRAIAARGATGRPLLLRTLRDHDSGAADSGFVADVVDRLLLDGFRPDPLPVPVRTAEGRVLHPDITFAERRVLIECDGLGPHTGRVPMEKDHRKTNGYLVAGWTPLRLSWFRMERDWQGFTAELAATLAG